MKTDHGKALTEDCARSIITGETGLAHTGAAILSVSVLPLISSCASDFAVVV
jgi:hypothetical protein